MSTALLPSIPPPGSYIAMNDVSWESYNDIRHETDDSHVRITYDSGRLVLMSPLPKHEFIMGRIGRLIEMATFEWNIPICSLGSTTWKRSDLLKGLEADECYYIQHEAQIRALTDLDLTRDPPPDLAVEVDITRTSLNRLPVYAALGIGEIWRHDGTRMQFLKLTADSSYQPIERSESLSRLTPSDIDRFLAMFGSADETTIMRAFRDWAHETKTE